MVTIVAHVGIKADRLHQFEEIERDLAKFTHAREPDCLRYECWRSATENKYYVLLAFRDAAAFYNHQISDYHEKHVPGLYECFDTIQLEFVDPVRDAGSGLPPTRSTPLPADSPALALQYEKEMPVVTQSWWQRAEQQGPVNAAGEPVA